VELPPESMRCNDMQHRCYGGKGDEVKHGSISRRPETTHCGVLLFCCFCFCGCLFALLCFCVFGGSVSMRI
jgi:hypothetical protein